MIEIRISAGNSRRWVRGILLFLGLVLALWLAYLVREIWLPLILALLIAMVLDPIVDRMERRGWSRLRGAAVIYLLFFITVAVILTFAVPAIITQASQVVSSIGQYLPSDSDTQTKRALLRLLHKAHANALVQNTVLNSSARISLAMGHLGMWFGNLAQGFAANLIWLVLIPILAFYFLKDFHILLARLLLLVPHEHRNTAERLVNDISAIFAGYLRGLVIVCALNAAFTAFVLAMFQVPNPLALGAISGVLYMVPYLGAALTILMIGAVVLMSSTVQMMLIVVVTMILLHHVIFDQIITPRIVGRHVGLHPILSLLALLVGGSLLGIVGMILAVPFAAIVQIVLVTLFPKLIQPIEVPEGERLHEKAGQIAEAAQKTDEIKDMVDVHQTLVALVDSADENVPSPEPASPQKQAVEAPLPPTADTTPPAPNIGTAPSG
ncbi:MAG TPA: AI-2E family transporter [Chthonomonadaceae bacterium]|nr:AI-2E family transporter [Chthonomonadaceae bacterium]